MTQVVSRRPVISELVFYTRLGHVGFVADEVALGKFFSPSTWVLPCLCHAINSVYFFSIVLQT